MTLPFDINAGFLRALLLVALIMPCATLANPVSTLEFEGIDGELLSNVRAHVRLVNQIQSDRVVSDAEWRRLRQNVPQEVREALEPFGYYNVRVKKSGPISSGTLSYRVQLNEPVRVRALDIRLEGAAQQQAEFQKWLREFPLRENSPLRQIGYENAKKQLMSMALRFGYFDARLTEHEIAINEDRTFADVNLGFDSGPRYTVSHIEVVWETEEGLADERSEFLTPSAVASYVGIRPGDYFNSEAMTNTQRVLLATPYFSSVDVQPGDSDESEAERAPASRPVIVTLKPNKKQAYNFVFGAGTDIGLRGSIGYENRRINERGHNLNARLGGSDIERVAIVNYRIPLQASARDSVNLFASFEDESSDSRRFETTKFGTEWSMAWQESMLKFGLTASRERFVRAESLTREAEQTTDLVMPSFRWEKVVSDDLYFPTQGWSASSTIRTANKSIASDIDLTQLIFEAKVLYPLGPGRLRGRIKAAGSRIGDSIDLPASLGFLAGGDDSIRGYKFESIGVERDGRIGVGKNLVVGSIEYEYPIKNGFAIASFIDFGDAFDGNPSYKKGAGIGLRWRLPFGALRLDAASALDRDGSPARLHFSFGTDL